MGNQQEVRTARRQPGFSAFCYLNSVMKLVSVFFNHEALEDIALFDIVELFKSNTALVSGSDLFLEAVDKLNGSRNEVSITVSDNNEPGEFIAKLIMKAHNQNGATYIFTGPLAERYDAVGFELWICNVTHDVLGEHPKSIHIHNIR